MTQEAIAIAANTDAALEHAFQSALAQIQAELRWLSLRLRVVVERSRRRRSVGPAEEYRGLYIADEEIDDFLAEDGGAADATTDLVRRAAELRRALDRRAAATLAGGRELPLDRLATEFHLTAQERQLLVLGLAPWMDLGYEKVYAYVNDDVASKWATVALALGVLSDDAEGSLRLRPLFCEDAPLQRNHLMSVTSDQHSPSGSLLGHALELDGHVAEVLLGKEGLDSRLHVAARIATVEKLGAGPAEALARVLRRRGNARVYLGGRWHGEKLAAVTQACAQAGLATIAVRCPVLASASKPATSVSWLLRDARLLRASLYFEGWPGSAAADGEGNALAAALASAPIDEHPYPILFSGGTSAPASVPVALDLHTELPPPAFGSRKQAWASAHNNNVGSQDVDLLAATFRFGVREIRSAVRMAESLAAWRGADSVEMDDLRLAARLQSQPHLTTLAQKIAPHFRWSDIVLPADRLAQLREIAAQVLHQHVVYDDWGFAAKSSLGRGVNALFAGPSGTGKTMAAEIIANELGLDLYKIDLSGLVSKYIGETEKNLARVFDEAGDTNAILFFDEADAVFGKRTEVRDSHDRYANIEVSYLLQKMEEYDGIVVMASNMRSNIDDAFLRRMQAIVEFPFPEAADRLHIWQRMLSASAPTTADIDLEFMARQFRIAGGNIKNIALQAAFLAATAGEAIGMSHLIRAAKREYQKMGRLISEADFGDWYEEARL